MLDCLGAAVEPRKQNRTTVLTGSLSVLAARLEHVTAKAPDGFFGLHPKQAGGLRIQIADRAALVDGVYAFDDSAEHRLRLPLASPQCPGQVHQIAAHVFHRACELADLGGAADRNRCREITLSQPDGRFGQRLNRAGDELAQQHTGEDCQSGENQGRDEQLADQATRGLVDCLRGQHGLEERDGLTRRGEYGNDRRVFIPGPDSLHRRAAVGQGGRIQRRVRVHRIVGERTIVDQVNLDVHALAQCLRQLRVQQQHAVHPRSFGIAEVGIRAENRRANVCRQ